MTLPPLSPAPSGPGIPQDLLDNILKTPGIPTFNGSGGGPAKRPYKVLWLSDHPLAVSGVGVQSRFLIEGLLATGKYTFQCLGGAIKHQNYELIQPKPGWVIKPVDGFGNKAMIRDILLTERPDAVVIFTDPRQFMWLWEMEDEIRQVCPIAYWHVWDNGPYPQYNNPWYESTDLINCISKQTYDLVHPRFPDRTNYIPHAFPPQVYNRLPPEPVAQFRAQNFGVRKDDFIALWVNRNATRKMPNDVLSGWKMFLDALEAREGHRKALLLMHTEPTDPEGPNLLMVSEQLGIQDNVWFSNQAQPFEAMNMLYNVADCTLNIAKAEGFGLSSLSSLCVGTPVINLMTGGLQRQVVDWRDGSEHGVALPVRVRSLVGSQVTPYIYEDFTTHQDIAAAIMKLYTLSPQAKAELSQRCEAYTQFEFSYGRMVGDWDKTLSSTIEGWKTAKACRDGGPDRRWSCNPVERLKVAAGPAGRTAPNLAAPAGAASPPSDPLRNQATGSPGSGHPALMVGGTGMSHQSVPEEVRGDISNLLRKGIRLKPLSAPPPSLSVTPETTGNAKDKEETGSGV